MWKMLITAALTNRWRLVHGGCTDLRSILPHYLGDTEHLHDTLGESYFLVTKYRLWLGKFLEFLTATPFELYLFT
jgi:hypothetical protein